MNIKSGLIAGFVATAVLSALMLIKTAAGLLPQLSPVEQLTRLASQWSGMALPVSAGWALHFLIGTVLWGLAYAVLWPVLPGTGWVKGLGFGVLAWLAMMLVFMPLTGAGLFGLALGGGVAIMALAMHLVYGAVLGATYRNAQHNEQGASPRP